jgi:hypothetical protein
MTGTFTGRYHCKFLFKLLALFCWLVSIQMEVSGGQEYHMILLTCLNNFRYLNKKQLSRALTVQ